MHIHHPEKKKREFECFVYIQKQNTVGNSKNFAVHQKRLTERYKNVKRERKRESARIPGVIRHFLLFKIR